MRIFLEEKVYDIYKNEIFQVTNSRNIYKYNSKLRISHVHTKITNINTNQFKIAQFEKCLKIKKIR